MKKLLSFVLVVVFLLIPIAGICGSFDHQFNDLRNGGLNYFGEAKSNIANKNEMYQKLSGIHKSMMLWYVSIAKGRDLNNEVLKLSTFIVLKKQGYALFECRMDELHYTDVLTSYKLQKKSQEDIDAIKTLMMYFTSFKTKTLHNFILPDDFNSCSEFLKEVDKAWNTFPERCFFLEKKERKKVIKENQY